MTFKTLLNIPEDNLNKATYLGKAAATSKWVSTIHIHAKFRMVKRHKVSIKISSTHNEVAGSSWWSS